MTMGSVEIGEEHPLAVGGVDSVAEAPSEGFWAGYWKTLKPLAVEEPVDVWIHRPLAYVLAKALYPTPVSPNLVTMISIVFGVLGACCFLADFSQPHAARWPRHLHLGDLRLRRRAARSHAGHLERIRAHARRGRRSSGERRRRGRRHLRDRDRSFTAPRRRSPPSWPCVWRRR